MHKKLSNAHGLTVFVSLEQKVETAESKSRFLRMLRHVLILKTCFDVANIIFSYIMFEKPLDLKHVVTFLKITSSEQFSIEYHA